MKALNYCLEQHSPLSAVVRNADNDKSYYERAEQVDLANHVEISDGPLSSDVSELEAIEKLIPAVHDQQWQPNIPPWKIVVLPLQPKDEARTARCFIAFSFSHALGDGISGLAFHRSFLQGLQQPGNADKTSTVIHRGSFQLAPPFDTRERLPISWMFLLGPFIAVYLPQFIANLFGLRAAASTIDAGTWTGSPIFYEPKTYRTKVKVLEIEERHVKKALQACRAHDAKLTGLFHQFIVRALSESLPSPEVTNLVSQTAINMRGSVGVSDDDMGLYVSGDYEVFPRMDPSSTDSTEMWTAASTTTKKLAECAATLQDQPVGLLRFLPSITKWTRGKIGEKRDCSYELSNLGAFDLEKPVSGSAGDGSLDRDRCRICKVVFSQPGNVPGGPLEFNVVSIRGGSLVCVVSWQEGALGIGQEEEAAFVEGVGASIRRSFETLA